MKCRLLIDEEKEQILEWAVSEKDPQFYWPEPLLRSELFSQQVVGGVLEDQVVAFAVLRHLPDAIELVTLATKPGMRGRGFMANLLQHVSAMMREGKALWLEVHEANLSARGLYKKIGFQETGRRPHYYRDGGAAILMTLV